MVVESTLTQVSNSSDSNEAASAHFLSDEVAVAVRHVSKMYPLYAQPSDRLKQSLWYALPAFLRGQPRQFYREFWALHEVSFELKRGEALGIIGRNGSGKSTLLQIIAGTLAPTAGEVEVNGRVAALLELGSGFNLEFTGRENVYLNGAILGFSREEMDELFDEIAAFADIGQFMDQPVKHYSSGMFVRLAFAVQACVEPDILIVDEALSVGDIFFQQKCHARMEQLLTRNTAVILVSHDMSAIEKYSSKTLLLDQGNCVFLGQPNEAVQRYYKLENSFKGVTISQAPLKSTENEELDEVKIFKWPSEHAFLNLSHTHLLGEDAIARCTGIALCNEEAEPCAVFEIGETAYFYFEFELLQDIEIPVGGVVIINQKNIQIHGKNSLHNGARVPISITRKGCKIRFCQTMELQVGSGEYTFLVGFATISLEDYIHSTEMNSGQLDSKTKDILAVMHAGKFTVQQKLFGPKFSFHGYANLPGSSALSIIRGVEH